MIKKSISIFWASILIMQSFQVFAVLPHSKPPSAEEQRLRNSICAELRKGAPSSWLRSLFFGEAETLDIEKAPFKDYLMFFYTIYTALNRMGYGDPIDATSVAEKADAQLRLIIHATKLPEKLGDPAKFKEYSDHIDRIKAIFLRSLDDAELSHWQQLKLQLLNEVKSFLEKFSADLSKEKIGFRELRRNDGAESNYATAGMVNAPRLAELYFQRMEKAGRPRVLIVGNGRALSSKAFMDNLVASPDGPYGRYAGLYYQPMWRSPANILGAQCLDDEFYGDSKYDYFLVDINPMVRPDVCLDMENPGKVVSLGKGQWDFVLFEGYYNRYAVDAAKMLLKPKGLILGNWFSDRYDGERESYRCFTGPFTDSEGIFTATNLGVIYEKP